MNFFEEPSEPQPEPAFVEYDGLRLRLITEHSLWGHVLWNAAKVIAKLIESNTIDVRNKAVLELGAGAALPSIRASLHGAKRVVATDFPEQILLDNIAYNAQQNCAQLEVQPLLWGNSVGSQFDIIFLSDLVFNHAEHANLVKTLLSAMHSLTEVHCLFSHHLPHRKQKDLEFIRICERSGLRCDEREPIFAGRMFPEDDVQFAKYDMRDREFVFWWVISK